MGLTKTEAFGQEQNLLGTLAKALGHPARIAILQAVAAQPGCVCGDLVLQLPLSQATISQHLKELKEAGLIQGEVSGPRMCYCLNGQALRVLQDFLLQLQHSIVTGCCDTENC